MDLLELLSKNDVKSAVELLQTKGKASVSGHAAEYENDREQRESQIGKIPAKQTTKGDDVAQSRIPIPFQRNIVKSAASFLFGNPVKLSQKELSENNDVFKAISDLWDDLRLDSLLLKFCEKVKSETEATIIFFSKEGEEGDPEIKARVLSSENGKVYPYIDAFGTMTGFGWEYQTTESDKEVSYMYLWTKEFRYLFKKEKDWELVSGGEGKKPNLFGKIPVVYLSQNHPEWWEVQELIDTYEVSFSKFIDTNRYFASPKYKALGKMKKSIVDAKVVELDIVETDNGQIVQSDLQVISWDRAPEALKLEFETTKELINGLSNTVDFEKLSQGGFGQLSGTALNLMFLGPILKAKWSEGDYQVVISRVISLLKAGLENITKKASGDLDELRINATFTSILPENLKEIVEVLSETLGGKQQISVKTMLKHHPLVENVEDEIAELDSEASKETKTNLGETVGL